MKRSAALFFAVIFLISTLFSCSQAGYDYTACREIVSAMAEAEIGLPAGKYYSMSAPEGDEEHLSDSLISALFGNGSLPKVSEEWLDCALFLSLNESPCELAVVLCSSRDAAEDTAKLFHSRLSAIKVVKTSPEYSQMIENATVTITGNYAIFIISSDTSHALRSAKKAIRRH